MFAILFILRAFSTSAGKSLENIGLNDVPLIYRGLTWFRGMFHNLAGKPEGSKFLGSNGKFGGAVLDENYQALDGVESWL